MVMIDKNMIEKYAEDYAYHNCSEEENYAAYLAFIAGINWFLGNLLHRYNEIPRKDYSQVVLIRGNNQALPTILDMNDLMDNSEGEGDYECLWKGIVKTHQIKKWFYIEDLLKGANNG